MLAIPEFDNRLAFWSTTFMGFMIGLGKLLSLWRTVRYSAEREAAKARQAERERDQAMWARRDEHLDDLRLDLEAMRTRLRERDLECEDLRRQLTECWNESNRRKWPRMDKGPKGGASS